MLTVLSQPAVAVSTRGRRGLAGAKGADGTNGAAGAPGKAGADGKDGLRGFPGANGADGAAGAPGEAGEAGRAGDSAPNAAFRPGDSPAYFTPAVQAVADAALYAALPSGGLAVSAAGAVYRAFGDAYCVTREMLSVELGRSYGVRTAFTRAQNGSDPGGDAIRLGVLTYDANKLFVADVALRDFAAVTVGSGRQAAQVAVSIQPFAANNLPPSVCYVRPYVRTFGALQATDIEVLRFLDLTDAILYAPETLNVAAALAAEITRAESAEAALNPFGATVVADKDYAAAQADLGITYGSLSAARTLTLPPLNGSKLFRPFPIADESGLCSPDMPIKIVPFAGDLLNGAGAPINLETAFGMVTARAGTKTWLIA